MKKGGSDLNYQRVNEILKSPEMIEVLYQGNPVYIKNLQGNGVTANINLDNTPSGNPVPVPLYDLIEDRSQY